MWWLIAVILLLALFLFMRCGAILHYDENGFLVKISAGLIKIKLYPKDEREKKTDGEKKETKAKKKEKSGEEQTEKGGPSKKITDLWPAVKEVLSRFRKKLTIEELTVYFTSASEDPFDAAMNFGRASALAGIVIPVIEGAFKVKQRDVRTNVGFDGEGDYIFLNARFTLRVWEIIYIVFGFLPLLKKRGRTKDGKAVKNGQTSGK